MTDRDRSSGGSSAHRISEPEVLHMGKEFEKRFHTAYTDQNDFERGTAVCRSCQVVRSRGTERSMRVDGSGRFVADPDAEAVVKTISPIVICGIGFVDLLVIYTDDDELQCHVVIEIKNTDWNQRQPHRLIPLMARHRRQIYGYLEPLEFRQRHNQIGRPQAIIVYPERPSTNDRDQIVREYFESYGIWVEYAAELLADAEPSDVMLEPSNQCKQSWLREPPACEKCAPGEVIILTNSRSESNPLTELRGKICSPDYFGPQ